MPKFEEIVICKLSTILPHSQWQKFFYSIQSGNLYCNRMNIIDCLLKSRRMIIISCLNHILVWHVWFNAHHLSHFSLLCGTDKMAGYSNQSSWSQQLTLFFCDNNIKLFFLLAEYQGKGSRSSISVTGGFWYHRMMWQRWTCQITD